jgi:hypothetical protein
MSCPPSTEKPTCGCQKSPCNCAGKNVPTLCDGDRRNNCWIEGGNPETGEGGACLLDTLTREIVINVLQQDNGTARADLLRVTTDSEILELARTVQRNPTGYECDETMQAQNTYIPLYTAFSGNPPFAQ